MTVLDVVVDKARVTGGAIEAFPQILKEDRHEHCPNGHAHDCQAVCCWRLMSRCGCVTSGCARGHNEPRPHWMLYQIGGARVKSCSRRAKFFLRASVTDCELLIEFQGPVKELGGCGVGLHPVLPSQKSVDLIRQDQLLEGDLLRPQPLHQVHRLSEGHVAVIISMNEQH